MVWCGVVWSGVVWCGLVVCSMWCGYVLQFILRTRTGKEVGLQIDRLKDRSIDRSPIKELILKFWQFWNSNSRFKFYKIQYCIELYSNSLDWIKKI